MSISKILISDIDRPFQDKNFIHTVDLRNTSFLNNSMQYAFDGCNSLTSVSNIPNNITNMAYAFSGCINLTTTPTIPDSVRDLNHGFHKSKKLTSISTQATHIYNYYSAFSQCDGLTVAPTLSNDAADCSLAFSFCENLTTAPIIPASVSNIPYMFTSCPNLTGNVYISSYDIRTATQCFNNTSLQKNVFIPFTTPCQDQLFCFVESEVRSYGAPEYIYTKSLVLSNNMPIYDGSGTLITRFNVINTHSSSISKEITISNSTMPNAVEYKYTSNGDMTPGSYTKTYNELANAGYATLYGWTGGASAFTFYTFANPPAENSIIYNSTGNPYIPYSDYDNAYIINTENGQKVCLSNSQSGEIYNYNMTRNEAKDHGLKEGVILKDWAGKFINITVNPTPADAIITVKY